MAILLDIDGFYHHISAGAQSGSGWIGTYDVGSNQARFSFDQTVKRVATKHFCSLKADINGVIAYIGRNLSAGVACFSFYFRYASAPAAQSEFFHFTGPGANRPKFLMESDGKVTCQIGSGTARTTSGSYADGNWHRLDISASVGGTTYTCDWQVDGSAQTQATLGGMTGTTFGAWAFGSQAATTQVFNISDFIVGNDPATQYPLGAHIVLPAFTTGNGTHNLGSTNPIIASTGTDMEAMVDDWDGGGSPSTADYITYTSTTLGDAASNYAEITLANSDAGYNSAIWGVIAYWAGFAAGTQANGASLRALTGGDTPLDQALDYSGSTTVLGYYRKAMGPPTGGWDATKFDAMVLRWGFASDTNPQPRLSAVMVEYVCPESAGPQTVTAAFIDNSAVIYAPKVNQAVSGAFVDQSAVIYAPTVKLKVSAAFIDQSAVLYAPKVSYPPFAVPFIDQSAVIYAPTVKQRVNAAFIDNSAVVYAPIAKLRVGLAFIDQSSIIYAPTVISLEPQEVDADFIDNSAVLYAPTVKQRVGVSFIDQSAVIYAPKVNQKVSVGFIDQTAVLYTPTAKLRVATAFIDQSAVLYAPSVKQKVVVGLIDQAPVIYEPTVVPAGVNVEPPLIDNAAVIYEPLVQQAGAPQEVDAEFIDQSAVTYAPTVKQRVGVSFIDNSATIFAPSVKQRVEVGFIDQTAVIFDPRVLPGGKNVLPQFIDQSAIIFSPTIVPAGVSVEAGLIDNAAVVYAPTVIPAGTQVRPGRIDQTPVIYAPTVTPAGVEVRPGLIDQAAVIYAPMVAQRVITTLISQSPQIFAPNVQQRVGVGLITQAAVIYSPSIREQVVAAFIDNAAELFAPEITRGILHVNPALIEQLAEIFEPMILAIHLQARVAGGVRGPRVAAGERESARIVSGVRGAHVIVGEEVT